MASDIVLSAFKSILSKCDRHMERFGDEVPIPQFDSKIVIQLCDEAIKVLAGEPILVHVDPIALLVGDLHGSLHDLLRILADNGIQGINYVFLGDYVDRGHFSTEVILILLALKVSHPNIITLLRGNHESVEICSAYGFKNEILSDYSEEVFDKLVEVFSYLPLAAIVDKSIFCVHGGISPYLQTLDQIRSYQKPIKDFQDPLIKNLVWSDPTQSNVLFKDSDRLGCYVFGLRALNEFLKMNNLTKLVRAHQCVQNGVQWHWESCATVFSSSSYAPNCYNKCGTIKVLNSHNLIDVLYEPITKMTREHAQFFTISPPKKHPYEQQLTFMLKRTPSGQPRQPQMFNTGLNMAIVSRKTTVAQPLYRSRSKKAIIRKLVTPPQPSFMTETENLLPSIRVPLKKSLPLITAETR
ncbi:Serine/threonine-protein phosphatase 4 catalytic subunit 1 [Tritrichomonas foetus]|uniref:Serine/threonine-protein phosphatase n=1 Tax=Tritrichomonas foetus TaxID=1144522 RepID=A0A1J4KD55_9EUKA|nr:Serine/threonine-protein phosphatase 4 catalytic subunit 1 [Tritrichomonas foetus]|eukprot:OHT08898.1 Serine/threonine-protein phosphatase 4 catalytic subunit 1 [Tritrichomonas foetus]